MSETKKLYNSLVDSGDLELMFTSMTGRWSIDKSSFTKQFEANEELIKRTITRQVRK